jgi:hypothetical protein
MASPHVAGVVAVYLSQRSFTTVAEAFDFVKSVSSLNRLKGIKGAFNGIVFNDAKQGVDKNPPPAPLLVKCGVITCLFRSDCDICSGFF